MEDSRRVVSVIEAAVRDGSAAQVVTDQGTPYCSREARAAYEALGLEHAPTREGTPTQKPTIERAFRTIKTALAPIVALTSAVAASVPTLRSAPLAMLVGHYIVALALDAYRLGRTSRVGPSGPVQDRALVEAQVEDWTRRRRDEHGSTRLLLERIHEEYRMEGSREDFVRALRRHRLEDIQEAERRLRDRACRCEARWCDRYFAGILRNVAEEGEHRRASDRARLRDEIQHREEDRQWAAEQSELSDNPELAISRGLRIIAGQWQADKRQLLMGGRGMGYSDLRHGLVGLLARHGPHAARDAAETIWRGWEAGPTPAGDAVRAAVRDVWDALIAATLAGSERDFTSTAARLIINLPPPSRTTRSPT